MKITTVIPNCTMLCKDKVNPDLQSFCTIVRTDSGTTYVVEHEPNMVPGDEIAVVDTLLFWGDQILSLIDGCEPPPTLGEMTFV